MDAIKEFETKAYYNQWLKELTDTEKDLILDMLNDFAIVNLTETKDIFVDEDFHEAIDEQIKKLQ